MKKLLLLTKTLLVVALLCVGQNAWGDAAITRSWTFTGLDANTAITKSEASLTEAGTTCNLATAPSCCAGLYFNENWQVYQKGDSNPGLRNISSGDRMVIIPNLKKGDIITITGNSDAINNINTTKYTGTKDDVKNTLTFTMSADGNFYFKMVKSGGKVNDVTVYPSIKSIVVTHDYTKVYSADFENSETYLSGWVKSNNYDATITRETHGTGNALYLKANSSRGSSLTNSFSALTDFETASSFCLEFDFAMTGQGSGNNAEAGVVVYAGSNVLFSAKTPNTAWTTSLSITGYDGTITLNSYSGTATPWIHVVLTGYKDDGVYATVINTTGSAVLVDNKKIANFSNITSFVALTGRSNGKLYLDDIVCSIDIAPYKTRATSAISAYDAVKARVMNSTVKSTLDGAKTALDAFADDAAIAANISGYISAISALETANGNAVTSADNFVILNELIGNSKPAGYVAPSGAETKYASNADVDPVALASAVRAAIITAGTANENTDISGLIINNSFELGTTYGWTTIASDDTGAKNNNDPYTTSGIDGSYQFNTWSKGTPITQTIGTLPEGKYKLACKVASDADNVIYLIVNESHNAGTTATGKGTYLDAEYIFSLGESTEVTIGAVGGNADGSYIAEGGKWYKADKFTITYLGEDPLEVAKKALNDEIDAATDVKNAWTPKVGTAPFKYDASYYNALVTEIEEAQAIVDADGDDVEAYTTAESELETAKTNIASSTLNQPDENKFYRLYLANDGTSTGLNLNLLKGNSNQLVVSSTPYAVQFVADGSNYKIVDVYGNFIAAPSNYVWGTYTTSQTKDSHKWGASVNNDGTVQFLNQNSSWKNWGWYIGTRELTDNSVVAGRHTGNKEATYHTWLCSDPVEVTDVNLAVNATTKWGTFIAPYDNLIPSTVKAYTVSHKDGNIVYFEENETGVLSANTPYILSTEEVSNVSVAFKGIANNDENTYEVNGLVGLLAAETVPANSYILQYQAGKVGTAFYKLASDMTGTAYRCYLDLDNVPVINNARTATRMSIYGGVTGVENAEVAEATAKKNGAYLENGKIAIYKNGMKYNANGQQVK